MADALPVEQPTTLDLLADAGTPGLSATSDMPVVETKPDAQAAPTPEPEVKVEEEAELQSESATDPESTSEDDQPKKARGVQKRLDELTKQREEEKARAIALEERLAQALGALENLTGKPPQEPVQADKGEGAPVRPNLYDFETPEAFQTAMMDYADANARWQAEQAVKSFAAEQQKKAELDRIEKGQREVHQAYMERVTKAKEKYADFSEVAESPDVIVSTPVAHVLASEEWGPDVQYYLGKHPAEAKRIMQLSIPSQLAELGRMAERVSTPAQREASPISSAPKPIRPLAAKGDTSNKDPESMSMEEYAAMRKASGQSLRH